MRHRRSGLFGLLLLGFVCLGAGGGCIDGVNAGVQSGVEGALSAAIEAIISNALAPLTPQ